MDGNGPFNSSTPSTKKLKLDSPSFRIKDHGSAVEVVISSSESSQEGSHGSSLLGIPMDHNSSPEDSSGNSQSDLNSSTLTDTPVSAGDEARSTPTTSAAVTIKVKSKSHHRKTEGVDARAARLAELEARRKEKLDQTKERLLRKLEQQQEREMKVREKKEKKEREELEKLERLKQKEDERLKKEEQMAEKNRRLEEKQKKEEEKKLKEEEKIKQKSIAKERFLGFFIKSATTPTKSTMDDHGRFRPFELKPFMTLAPVCPGKGPVPLKDLDMLLQQTPTASYIELVKKARLRGELSLSRKRSRSEVVQEPEVVCLDQMMYTDQKPLHDITMKFLQFHDNVRPAYFGSWRKRSKCVNGRCPFQKDEELLNYDIDSDEDWEEEPGESIAGSENEVEEDKEDEDDDDNDGFFVPHGYLSEDEGVTDSDGESVVVTKSDKAQVQSLEAEFDRGWKPLNPLVVGCTWSWTDEDAGQHLTAYRVCPFLRTPLEVTADVEETCTPKSTTPTSSPGIQKPVPDTAMPSLIQHLHGNPLGIEKIIASFMEKWHSDSFNQPISKRQLQFKIMAIAVREKRSADSRTCYYVREEILNQFGLDHFNSPAPVT